MYQSIPSLTILSPGQPLGNSFNERISHTPGQMKNAKPWPLGQKNGAKTPTPGQFFSKIPGKNATHQTEIKKNSTEILNNFAE